MVSIDGLGLRGMAAEGATQGQQNDTDLQNVSQSEFLKLLVAQLQNQDPLSPVQNQEFVAQLATFSSLEQLISINKAVTQLAESSGSSGSGTEDTQNTANA